MTAITLVSADPEQLNRIERKLDQLLSVEPQDEWMTIDQICVSEGVSPATIRRRVKTGEVEAKGRGKMRRFRT